MSTLTIRNLDEQTHARLRERAAKNGRSVEAEAIDILRSATDAPEENVLLALHSSFAAADGVDLELLQRSDQARPVDFS